MSELTNEESDSYYRVEMPEYRIGKNLSGYGFNSDRMFESFNIWYDTFSSHWIIQHSINHTTFLEV